MDDIKASMVRRFALPHEFVHASLPGSSGSGNLRMLSSLPEKDISPIDIMRISANSYRNHIRILSDDVPYYNKAKTWLLMF